MTPSSAAHLDLRDIHAAAPPAFWPPAPGWWLLAVLVAATLGYGVFVLIRYYRRRRLQQRILATLDELESAEFDNPALFVSAVSTLLRRVALMRFRRSEVASLSGDAWLRFLDATGGGGTFADGPGNVLATAPYAREPEAPARQELLALAREWIKHNAGAGA